MEADRADQETAPVDLRRDGAAALEWAASYLERVGELPVLAQVDPGDIRASLPSAPPERGEPFARVLRDLDAVLMPGITHWQSPRFFAYFSVTGSEPGVLAELLIAALNNVGILWRTSPALQELEEVTLDWVAQLLGLPRGWHGHIEDTASTSTITALAAAREAKPGARVVVASEHAHSSVDKAVRLLGLELAKVPDDATLRLGPEVCAVIATVGTTSSASVDPVPAWADACEAVGGWLHVDAAYAGSAWSCEEHRWSQAGVERASSLVVNAHKWLFTPMDCSLLWTSRPDDVRNAFSLIPEYLRSPEDVASLSEYAPALGRRFRALKLWTILRCYGAEGIRARIREAVRLSGVFASWVDAEPGWELVSHNFSLVCFRCDGSDEENEALLERVNATGEIFISHTRLEDRYLLRLAIGNARTTEDDVRRAWEVLEALRAVIFDLWDTLALWPSAAFERVKWDLSRHIADFERVWDTTYRARQVGAIEDYFRSLGVEGDALAECLRLRSDFTRNALVPRDGAIETLDELQRRGFKRGLISVCSSDVEEQWEETAFASHLDDVVLSCAVGLSKPDPRIYELACERLGVEPHECLFVGDGANDELAGARRVGMHAVCVLPPGRAEPLWREARGWEPTITSLEDVLQLV